MDLVYRPKGGQEQRFEIDSEDFRLSEIAEIEKLCGKPFHEFMLGVGRKSTGDMRPLLYTYLKRVDPAVKYVDVDPTLREWAVEASTDAELETARAAVAADESLGEEYVAALDEQIAASGKGRSTTRASGSATGRSRRSGKRTS